MTLFAGMATALITAATAGAAEPTFSAQRFDADIKTLSSDAFEGRAPATRGEQKTVAYLIEALKAAKVQPGGDPLPDGKRAWTQDVPLLQSNIVGMPSLSIAQGNKRTALTQGQEIAVRAPMNGADRVSLKDVPVVFVGYGVTAPEKNWDDFKGVDVRGKIIVVLINDPDFETGDGDFGGKAMTYYGRWTYKYEEGARRGAAGVLVVHETGPASYGWATVKNSNTNTTFDIVRRDPARAHVPIEGWIQRDLAESLFKAAGLDFDMAKKQAQSRDFKPIALRATFSAAFDAKPVRIVSKNVVGRLAGAGHPDETVIYSAHWDHLGIGLADARGDRIYNGALDNASGTAALLEMARAYGGAPRPDRSVVFLAVTAEERGLLGSEYYAQNPLYPLATTVGAINTDGFSLSGAAHNFSISGSAKLGLLDDLIALGQARGRTFTPDPHPEAGSFFRSDHFSLAKVGVPAISFSQGNDLIDGGTERGEAERTAYTRDRYHQPADEWRPDFRYDGALQNFELLYALGRRLADSREWPEWSADSEFRKLRDATAAQRK